MTGQATGATWTRWAINFSHRCVAANQPPPTTGQNCYSICGGAGGLTPIGWTHGFGPTTSAPTFAAHVSALQTAFNTQLPGGPAMSPMVCGPNWGANQGQFYVPNTLTITPNTEAAAMVSASDPQCQGAPRFNYCISYQCARR